MLIAALLSAIALQAVATQPDVRCYDQSVHAVVRGDDDAEPFVLETVDGHRFRTLGTDFIHVDEWKQGESLRICPQQMPYPVVQITDVPRNEDVIARPEPERVYADTCVERESGDIAGQVIAVSGRGAHPRVTFYWSEGALMQPVGATAAYSAADRHLRFEISTAVGVFMFDGEVKPHGLAGTLREPWQRDPHQVTLIETSRAAALSADRPVCRLH